MEDKNNSSNDLGLFKSQYEKLRFETTRMFVAAFIKCGEYQSAVYEAERLSYELFEKFNIKYSYNIDK